PGEGASDAESERLADRLLAGESSCVVLRRIRPRVAVGALGLGEAPLTKGRIALEGAPNARDFDQIDADGHEPILGLDRIETAAAAKQPRHPERHGKRRLSQVDADGHNADSRNAGTSAIESRTASGCALPRWGGRRGGR